MSANKANPNPNPNPNLNSYTLPHHNGSNHFFVPAAGQPHQAYQHHPPAHIFQAPLTQPRPAAATQFLRNMQPLTPATQNASPNPNQPTSFFIQPHSLSASPTVQISRAQLLAKIIHAISFCPSASITNAQDMVNYLMQMPATQSLNQKDDEYLQRIEQDIMDLIHEKRDDQQYLKISRRAILKNLAFEFKDYSINPLHSPLSKDDRSILENILRAINTTLDQPLQINPQGFLEVQTINSQGLRQAEVIPDSQFLAKIFQDVLDASAHSNNPMMDQFLNQQQQLPALTTKPKPVEIQEINPLQQILESNRQAHEIRNAKVAQQNQHLNNRKMLSLLLQTNLLNDKRLEIEEMLANYEKNPHQSIDQENQEKLGGYIRAAIKNHPSARGILSILSIRLKFESEAHTSTPLMPADQDFLASFVEIVESRLAGFKLKIRDKKLAVPINHGTELEIIEDSEPLAKILQNKRAQDAQTKSNALNLQSLANQLPAKPKAANFSGVDLLINLLETGVFSQTFYDDIPRLQTIQSKKPPRQEDQAFVSYLLMYMQTSLVEYKLGKRAAIRLLNKALTLNHSPDAIVQDVVLDDQVKSFIKNTLNQIENTLIEPLELDEQGNVTVPLRIGAPEKIENSQILANLLIESRSEKFLDILNQLQISGDLHGTEISFPNRLDPSQHERFFYWAQKNSTCAVCTTLNYLQVPVDRLKSVTDLWAKNISGIRQKEILNALNMVSQNGLQVDITKDLMKAGYALKPNSINSYYGSIVFHEKREGHAVAILQKGRDFYICDSELSLEYPQKIEIKAYQKLSDQGIELKLLESLNQRYRSLNLNITAFNMREFNPATQQMEIVQNYSL